ncbi:hypothetical protein ACMZ29_00550 [Brevibacterium casei]|uniref:hypothetical protein n=1 Tax=Brevibacterium casei TaxID=33889 RepID=UPI0039F0B674
MTRLRTTHSNASVRPRAEALVDHHGSIRATAEAVGVSYDTLARILRFPNTTVQERTYQAITRAHAAMLRARKRRDTVAGAVVADFATTPEGRAFIAECRGEA